MKKIEFKYIDFVPIFGLKKHKERNKMTNLLEIPKGYISKYSLPYEEFLKETLFEFYHILPILTPLAYGSAKLGTELAKYL